MNKIVSKLPALGRVFLGLLFVWSGLNGLLQLVPLPPVPPEAGAFLGGLAAAGYFFPMLKGLEVVIGIALLLNRFVPFALILLSPIAVNIALFHLFLTPGEAGLSIALVLVLAFLGWSYRSAYRSLFEAKAVPDVSLERSGLPAASPAFRAGRGA